MFDRDQRGELFAQQRLMYAAALGLTAGMTATMFYSLGAFIPPLQAEFGWSRGDLSLAATFLTLAVFLTGTFAGRLCDRYGASVIGALSLLAYALAIVVMVATMTSLIHFWIAYFVIAVVGVGSTPIVLVRPITTGFFAARGIALGVALTGAGIAGFWVPRLVTEVATAYGWREAYLALAGIAALVAPFVWWGFRSTSAPDASAAAPADGLSHAQARSQRSYWLLSLMAFAMACGIAGVVVHLLPLFVDLGADTQQAAKMASTVGVASVAGRLVVGYFLDRLPAILVSVAVLLLAGAGIALLALYGRDSGYLAAALLGLAAGAEIDLLAYLTVSYFGRRHYGAIYGWQYSVFALGYGISPYLVGRVRDAAGSYDAALLLSGGLMLLAAGCCLALPAARPRRAESLARPQTP
ncbi:MFS transporter [Spongiibacter taiwanensis]|uniref:MFS transporter n=1 Tax=Spongiibacter taiwanensis TaxID=1748242 RepID=UPI0020352FD9|nr:MFS transporter [Spongiibacter taiwanensis]USA42443.1 MFS transporter [Spongiibacter taiwanensis]